MVKLWIQKLKLNLKCRMYLEYMMYKPSICTIWYIEYDSIFFIKFGWENIHGNVFSDTVFLEDTLIEIKGKFL